MKTIFEKVYVETPVDTDGDGQRDLIAVYIKRLDMDKKIPAVFVANPYLLHCNEAWYDLYDVNTDIQAYPTQNICEKDITYTVRQPKYIKPHPVLGCAETHIVDEPSPDQYECVSDLYDHLIGRGYAAVFSGGLGTKGSDGLTITGSYEEILAFKSVIEWLNGNARAFTDREHHIEICAKWCTGATAMSARSYLGTMAIGVACTGVEGLKTIVPEAGISNWYEYYRHNGLTLPAMDWQGDDIDILAKYCFSRALDADDFEKVRSKFEKSQQYLQAGADRHSGNYNLFWDERNYLKRANRIRASVFILQGLNDWNVKPDQGIRLFERLQALGIERKLLLHQGRHIYTYHLKGAPTLSLIDRWLDHYLKGTENGIEKEAKVYVESNLDPNRWITGDVWPPVHSQVFRIRNDSQSFIDDLSKTVYNRKEKNVKAWLEELVLKDTKHALKYEVCTLKKDTRFAGRAEVSFQAKIDRPTAILSAMLVDYGSMKRMTDQLDGDENISFTFKKEMEPSEFFVITRG